MKTVKYISLILGAVLLLTGCSLFSHKPMDFLLYQEEENIVEISRVTVSADAAVSQATVATRETVSGEQLAAALQALRALPCVTQRFPPLDTWYNDCFMITYADGSFQLLSVCKNDYFDKEYQGQRFQNLEFDQEAFKALWKQGFGALNGE